MVHIFQLWNIIWSIGTNEFMMDLHTKYEWLVQVAIHIFWSVHLKHSVLLGYFLPVLVSPLIGRNISKMVIFRYKCLSSCQTVLSYCVYGSNGKQNMWRCDFIMNCGNKLDLRRPKKCKKTSLKHTLIYSWDTQWCTKLHKDIGEQSFE